MSEAAGPQGHGAEAETPTGDELVAKTEAARGASRNLFDLRYVIAALLAIYGIILVVYGVSLGSSADQLAKAGGVPLNLWAGVVMLVVAAGFALWGTLKPVQ